MSSNSEGEYCLGSSFFILICPFVNICRHWEIKKPRSRLGLQGGKYPWYHLNLQSAFGTAHSFLRNGEMPPHTTYQIRCSHTKLRGYLPHCLPKDLHRPSFLCGQGRCVLLLIIAFVGLIITRSWGFVNRITDFLRKFHKSDF